MTTYAVADLFCGAGGSSSGAARAIAAMADGGRREAAGQAAEELTPTAVLTPEIVADIRRRAERRDRKGWEASVVPVEALYALCDAADALARERRRAADLERSLREIRGEAYYGLEQQGEAGVLLTVEGIARRALGLPMAPWKLADDASAEGVMLQSAYETLDAFENAVSREPRDPDDEQRCAARTAMGHVLDEMAEAAYRWRRREAAMRAALQRIADADDDGVPHPNGQMHAMATQQAYRAVREIAQEALDADDASGRPGGEETERNTMAITKSPTSEYVERFAALMERQLAANRHKGDRPGWLGESFDSLKSRLCDEVAELFDQITCDGPSVDIAKEAADVANFCLFIADKAGGL